MSAHIPMTVARMHGVLVTRPGSRVFHAYSGPLTPSGRFIPLAARTVCNARTRRLSVLERVGSVLDLGGRRMCVRCSARLARAARRAEQPISRDECLAFYRGITLADLVVATALTATVDETHRVGFVLSLLFGAPPARRPIEFNGRQALFDVDAALVRRRRALRETERTPDELEDLRRRRDEQAYTDGLAIASRRRADRIERAMERRDQGRYLMPHERELLAHA